MDLLCKLHHRFAGKQDNEAQHDLRPARKLLCNLWFADCLSQRWKEGRKKCDSNSRRALVNVIVFFHLQKNFSRDGDQLLVETSAHHRGHDAFHLHAGGMEVASVWRQHHQGRVDGAVVEDEVSRFQSVCRSTGWSTVAVTSRVARLCGSIRASLSLSVAGGTWWAWWSQFLGMRPTVTLLPSSTSLETILSSGATLTLRLTLTHVSCFCFLAQSVSWQETRNSRSKGRCLSSCYECAHGFILKRLKTLCHIHPASH